MSKEAIIAQLENLKVGEGFEFPSIAPGLSQEPVFAQLTNYEPGGSFTTRWSFTLYWHEIAFAEATISRFKDGTYSFTEKL